MKICLMMIVKNEENTISRCLESVAPWISQYLIVDTGSTDKTKEKICEAMVGVPGQVFDRQWVNFGHNRTELMALMPDDCDYALLLDADMTVSVKPELFTKVPNSDCLMLRVAGSREYRMPYLVRKGPNYRYVGSTHEYITADQNLSRETFDGFTIHHHADGGSRSDKFERDEKLLKNDLILDPNNSRTHFYLGQTFRDLGRFEEAIASYQKSKELSGWVEERYVSALEAAKLLLILGDQGLALDLFLQAIELNPTRGEAYYYLGKLLNSMKRFRVSSLVLSVAIGWKPSKDILFVERWIENWGLTLEYGVALWWSNDRNKARELFEQLLTVPDLPQDIVSVVHSNIAMC